jgi:hypothetical protein
LRKVESRRSLCLFMILTHTPSQPLSYFRIPGHPDLISVHMGLPLNVYTSQGGSVNMYNWKCLDEMNAQGQHGHAYQLFLSIDISSSPVLAIRTLNEASKELSFPSLSLSLSLSVFRGILFVDGLFLCSMPNGLISAYHTLVARESFKRIPPFPRATQVIVTLQLAKKRAVILDVSKQSVRLRVF